MHEEVAGGGRPAFSVVGGETRLSAVSAGLFPVAGVSIPLEVGRADRVQNGPHKRIMKGRRAAVHWSAAEGAGQWRNAWTGVAYVVAGQEKKQEQSSTHGHHAAFTRLEFSPLSARRVGEPSKPSQRGLLGQEGEGVRSRSLRCGAGDHWVEQGSDSHS